MTVFARLAEAIREQQREGKQTDKRTMQRLGMKPNRFYRKVKRKVKEYGL
ncbi:MAG: hypothetical protein K2J25_04905 [Oscillospiraceae bacterium]|nr:hypothetical protein [Oscillospiraceae bacterium]